jgi:DNA-binding NarL/FixJ family response regulator
MTIWPIRRGEYGSPLQRATYFCRLSGVDELELSALEVDVLLCAGRGLTVRESAAELHYSIAWVKENRANAMRALGARNIVDAVAIAMRRGLLELNARAQ